MSIHVVSYKFILIHICLDQKGPEEYSVDQSISSWDCTCLSRPFVLPAQATRGTPGA